ncbi:MAG: permease-like cell division protein FtsX [Methylophilaceae bacterium]|nr:permease-like cell division protein FtsX [Methylophilaceae bacterium]
MMEWLHAHRLALLITLKKLRATPLAHLLMAGVIGAALSLPSGLYLLVNNLERAAGNVSVQPQITLFLVQNTPQEVIHTLEHKLRKHPAIEDINFIPRDEAWKALLERNGLEGTGGELETNPLPDAFIVHANDTDPNAVSALQQELSRWPEVEFAQLDAAWVKRLHALLQLGNKLVVVLAGLLGFALLVIIGNTIRLQILTQRDEIEVSALIGATNRFIRRPFLYAGTLHGLLGGVMAWLILHAALFLFNVSVKDLAQLYGTDFRLEPLGLQPSWILIGCAAALGWVGSYFAVSRYLFNLERP